jgi:4-hydroxy-tetrahydrodipicolinate synthase
MHRRLVPLIDVLFKVANPIPIKYAMNQIGFRVGSPRPPLYEPDEATANLIKETLKKYRMDLPVK